MAKKREPDHLDKIVEELTRNATAAELANDPSVLRELQKRLVEAALKAEMTDHLGYEKHSADGDNTGNSRNGTSSKKILDASGEFVIDVPRDRNGAFEPQFVRKRQVVSVRPRAYSPDSLHDAASPTRRCLMSSRHRTPAEIAIIVSQFHASGWPPDFARRHDLAPPGSCCSASRRRRTPRSSS
ncbi:MAG: transposase [bacterium]|nr:transposase [bacterium]